MLLTDKHKQGKNNMKKVPLEELPGYSIDPELNPGEAELTTYLEGQDTPFIIRGPSEALEQQFRRDVQLQSRREKYAGKVAATAAVEHAAAPVRTITHKLGSFVADRAKQAEIKRFDRKHGTDIMGQLVMQREQEEILRFKQRIGLMAVDTCQKHNHAVRAANR
jgi:hypothetical protein